MVLRRVRDLFPDSYLDVESDLRARRWVAFKVRWPKYSEQYGQVNKEIGNG